LLQPAKVSAPTHVVDEEDVLAYIVDQPPQVDQAQFALVE
jgi:hypothetical protein